MLNTYVVTNASLKPADQAVQGMHALAELAVQRPTDFVDWNRGGNTLIFVTVPDHRSLVKLQSAAIDGTLPHAVFHEPDWGPEPVLTAIAFAPNWTTQYVLLADLPLALPQGTYTKLDLEILEEKAEAYRSLLNMTKRQRRKYFRNLLRAAWNPGDMF